MTKEKIYSLKCMRTYTIKYLLNARNRVYINNNHDINIC